MAQKSVYRTELTPVSFLERSACVFPDKVAVISRLRRVAGSSATYSLAVSTLNARMWASADICVVLA